MQNEECEIFPHFAFCILHSAFMNGDHDVTAASRPVKAFVPVRVRLVTPICPFRRAVEFGLSAKRETASGFKSRPSRQMAGFPSRLLSVALLLAALLPAPNYQLSTINQ